MSSLYPFPAPVLPSFRTILLQGKYHPSAPIHLCISHTGSRPDSKAIVLTPSRRNISSALEEYNDDWLAAQSGTGRISDISSRIDLFYPPTPPHLVLLLSMFQVIQPSDGVSFNSKFTLNMAPSLIVLHEPSAYFSMTSVNHSCMLSSYLTLITHALAAVAFLSASANIDIAFAVFDSNLEGLQLPILRPPETPDDEEASSDRASKPEAVGPLAQKYFEWVGTFERLTAAPEDVDPSSPLEDPPPQQSRLRLRRTISSDDGEGVTWEWLEVKRSKPGASEKRSTEFIWN